LARAKAFSFVRHVSLVLVCLLAGCADSATGLMATARATFSGSSAGTIDTAHLDPRYRYLRVVHPAGVSGMILGAIEQTPAGAIEVWYASDGEILRFQNGRLIGSTGLKPEWRKVVIPQFPSWSALASRNDSFRWERVRDVMPGYRYGVQDRLVLTVVRAPRSSRLIGLDPQQLTWFE
jgi:hypothetical protein